MAQEKIRGDQLDIQDFSDDVANDTTSISLIANGLVTDSGAIDVLNDDYIVNLVDIVVNANTVTDVFIYDTSLDDDGGAWIDEANWQSWYSETLGTEFRGTTKPFPRLAVIVSESGRTTVYDGTDSTLPMWMVIKSGSWIQYGFITASKAKNGVIYNGSNAGVDTGLLAEYHFIDDRIFSRSAAGKYRKNTGNLIADRHTQGTGNTTVNNEGLVNNTINDIVVTSDGNMNNIVGIASDAGVTRIAADDTTSHWNDLGNTVNIVKYITVVGDQFYWTVDLSTSQKFIDNQSVNVPLVDNRYSDNFHNHFTSINNAVWTSERFNFSHNFSSLLVRSFAENTVGTDQTLSKLYPFDGPGGSSMAANITTDYNSGIMQGDIRGAWLSSTNSTTLNNSVEMITNGIDWTGATGNTPPNNWTTDSLLVQFTISSGSLIIDRNGETDGALARMRQTITTVIGDYYLVSMEVVSSVDAIILDIGTAVNVFDTVSAAGVYYYTYEATTASTTISIRPSGTTGTPTIDNVSVSAATADRSFNNYGLSVYGTMDKTPVATGAELMGFNPTSSTGLLIQQHNTNLDFGTSDFYYMVWIKMDTSLENRIVWHQHSVTAGSGLGVELRMSGATGKLNWEVTSSLGISSPVAKEVFKAGIWTQSVLVRRNGKLMFYLNNELQDTANNAGDVTNALATLNVGALYDDVDTYSQYWDGSIALLRIGAIAPTTEQLTQIYEEEKQMFQENAKCTLQGTSSFISAVDYDPATNITTACSGDHITKFNGLVVVEDRAEVATSVSTVKDNEMTGA